MAIRPWGRAGDCISTMVSAGEDTGCIGALGMQIGDLISPIQGKGRALPHGLITTFAKQVSSGTGIASCLSTGGLRTQLNKELKGGKAAFLG